jgi:hypothetical protein
LLFLIIGFDISLSLSSLSRGFSPSCHHNDDITLGFRAPPIPYSSTTSIGEGQVFTKLHETGIVLKADFGEQRGKCDAMSGRHDGHILDVM